MANSPEIEVRNLRFKFDDAIPRRWFGGSSVASAYFDSQSLLFPAGERFFVQAVAAALPKIKDPELLRKAKAFCGQEGMHTREHVRYNRMLQERGYPADRLQRWIAGFLAFVRIISPLRVRLAITCAIEHFTAIGAARALGPRGFESADPRMRAFWRWHAAEELEHKSIPFDIYCALGGNYLERVVVMMITTVMYQLHSYVFLMCFMWIDGVLFSQSARREFRATMSVMGSPAEMWRDNLKYYKPSFHPSQLDDTPQLERFQGELASSPLYAAAR